jgi:hypothetical protein
MTVMGRLLKPLTFALLTFWAVTAWKRAFAPALFGAGAPPAVCAVTSDAATTTVPATAARRARFRDNVSPPDPARSLWRGAVDPQLTRESSTFAANVQVMRAIPTKPEPRASWEYVPD